MNLVTLGGNTIVPGRGHGTIEEQMEVAARAMAGVAQLLARGEAVVVSHGNGPIVGNIFIRNQEAKDRIPPMPLDVCGADSQGGIGYMLQQVLDNELAARGLHRTVVSLVTQCVVDPSDSAFQEPTKPIGLFYSAEEARYLERTKGWRLVEDAGRGFRRVVPSPRPLEIVECEAIRALAAAGVVVIAAGGGGVPVVREPGGRLRGVEAVIDKDRSAAVLGRELGAERLIVLTGVPAVLLDFGRGTQRRIETMTVEEARVHLAEGQFPAGSMGPKVEACVEFVTSGGREAIITSPADMQEALEGRSGTRILPGREVHV